MRRTGRAMALVFLTLLSSVVLGVASAMTAAITLAATALIVPGTGTHNVTTNTEYREQARDRFLGLTPCVNSCTGENLKGVDYPASFYPIPIGQWCPGLSCDTWNVSVGTGVTNLDTQLKALLASDDPEAQQIVVFGYSQGGAVVSHEMAENIANMTPEQKARITVVTIGNIENPQGLWSRFGSWTIPAPLDITFGPHLPTGIGVKSYNYDFEYDPVGDAPLYLNNGLALLNALAAFQYVHGYYLSPNANDPDGTLPYGYTDKTLAEAIAKTAVQTYQDASFILIPWQGTLPLFQPLVDLGNSTGTSAFIKPLIDLLQPATKALIDLAYDRTANPGIPQTFQWSPTIDPLKLTTDLFNAGVQGVDAFVKDLTPSTPPVTTVNPATTTAPKTDSQKNAAVTPLSDAKSLSSLLPSQKAKSGNLFRPSATAKAADAGTTQSGSKAGTSPSTDTATTATTGATGAGTSKTAPADKTAGDSALKAPKAAA